MKKTIIKYLTAACVAFTFAACSDFFNVETDNVLDNDNYIDEETEMAAGFFGIMTKVQAIGDKIIYITDTRAELLEVTTNAPSELYALYNWEQDLTGNSYADPAPYYDVILACNDYLEKMKEYKQNSPAHSINSEHYEALVAGTIRIKAWNYLNIAKIYGEAVWFDDALTEYQDIRNYELIPIGQVVKKCRALLENDYEGISTKATMAWEKYIDPEATGSTGTYFYWDYLIPPYWAIYGELCLWDEDFPAALETTLGALNDAYGVGNSQQRSMLRNQDWRGKTGSIWGAKRPAMRVEPVSVILYDYSNNQTNSLKKTFEMTYPNQYMLAPSSYGLDRYSDEEYNPGGSSVIDRRYTLFFTSSGGKYYLRKYSGGDAMQDDNFIYTYRGADIYMMLIEALNGVGRYEEVNLLMNGGIGSEFPSGGIAEVYPGFTDYWTRETPSGSTSYPDIGFRGVYDPILGKRVMSVNEYDDQGNLVKAGDRRLNDLAILDEMLLDFAAEGKTLPAMIRMALRHGDLNIISDRVCPKYENPEVIRQRIEAGGYFIKWDYGI